MKKEIYICDKCGKEAVGSLGFVPVNITWEPNYTKTEWKSKASYGGHLCLECAEKMLGW